MKKTFAILLCGLFVTNAFAAGISDDPNAVGIWDCVGSDDGNITVWYGVMDDCLIGRHNNYHATQAICKKFVADSYYTKYKDNTGDVNHPKLPDLIDGKYMLRCVATECESGYELARDKKGNSQGWCQPEKKSSDTATKFSCATLKFNDGKECKNITLGVSWKANTQFQGEHKTEADNIYFSCIDGNVAECSENLWNLNTVNGKSVTDLVKNATSLSFYTAYPASENDFEIAIHDCDKENGYVPGEILYDETANNDNYITYKRCIKKSSDGDANQGTPQKKPSDPKAPEVFTKLDKILDEHFTKSSVWKNDDGKFNTARLMSDSIAGVVLGTTGGIITSKIIKKNQIKRGFEDLKCVIGGQDVANYGDEFRVGVK